MAGYDQIIKIKAAYSFAAKDFFKFLQVVGRRYERPTKINYRYLGRGRFHITIDGSPGGINALFQELLLNKGLYYYICTIKNIRKKEIINYAVIPLFQSLLEYRFQNPYSRFVRRHLTGKVVEEKYIPGEFYNDFSHEYEILFRKWDIGSLDDWNFIKDLDAFLNKFMLVQINHRIGAKSPNFNVLVNQTYQKGVGMVSETKDLFNKIHKARTEGLHRLKTNFSKNDISELAFQTYNYFQYFDEFEGSQKSKTEKLHGKFYRRIKYGNEKPEDEIYGILDLEEHAKHPCHDCAAIKDQYHCYGCDVEQCPRCRGQFISCNCKLQKDYD